MGDYALLAVYSLLVIVASILGGSMPFLGRVTHSRLQLYLSLSAGVMIGAAFFHVMPDAIENCGKETFGWWMALAVVGLLFIERFIAPHSHEVDTSSKQTHAGDEHKEEECHDPEHAHVHQHAGPDEHRAAAPAVAGWMAVLGLTIHTFINGVGLAAEVKGSEAGEQGHSLQAVLGGVLPGLSMFLAIVLHKPADALAISTVLSRKGTTRRKLALVQLGFALMVPVGVLAFCVARNAIPESMKIVQKELTGAALAFSAGTFLFIALSDLLPEVQFHKHDRVPLFGALFLGVALMGGIALLEGH